ncbi:MAG TPA: response regulator [Candidatus Obscuribacterales bacterium]
MNVDNRIGILAVDDRADNLLALQAIFTDPAIKLVKARSGDEALQRLLDEEFAAILMDAHMPIMDGFETARTIRSREKTRTTPIIFLTATQRDSEHAAEGYDIGAVDYISKPLIPAVIKAKVAVFVELFKKTKEIRQQAEELRVYKTELEQKLVQLRSMNQELEAVTKAADVARRQAVNASNFKSEFLANMSHEIRTPMNGVLGMIEILLKSGLTERQLAYASTAKEAGVALLAVINDILDFSKIEAGKLSLQLAEFEPIKLVESIAELLAAQAKQQSLSLYSFVDPEIPAALIGDPGRLRQILTNFAGNAVKFSAQGEVLIRATLEAQDELSAAIKFSVSDQGIGLTDDEISQLFKPFVQSDAVNIKHAGTGLGLSISKRLVELMSGQLGVTSVKGSGSTFWFSVPLCKSSQHTASTIDFGMLSGVRILVVDDEPGARQIVHDYLTAWGMKNSTACSADEALGLLRSAASTDPYQLVVIDLFMPQMDGMQLGKTIRDDDQLKDAKLILITAFDKPGMGQEAILSGFDAYLTKPVKQSNLFNTITTLLFASQQPAKSGAKQGGACDHQKAVIRRRPELILVAEDHPINQQVALLLLHDLGFEAHVAENGRKAIEALERIPYNLVLMDCQMPEVDGFEATRSIRKLEALTGRHVPIIAMTAHAIEGNRDECLGAGMDDYICKPVEVGQLKLLIEKWLPPTVSTQRYTIESQAAAPTNADSNEICQFDYNALTAKMGEDGARQLLETFLVHSHSDLQKTKAAFSSGDAKNAMDAAHAAKGAAASLYARSLQADCERLERLARNNDWTAANDTIKNFELAWTALERSIRKCLDRSSQDALRR